jgi:DNA invertase Pin-like site-specific DNA recombinase
LKYPLQHNRYAKDISVKIKSSLHAKARRGEFLGANAPYGYLRDPNDRHRLIINHEVADNVKRLFELIIHGSSLHQIAKMYTAEGIFTPGDYIRFKAHDPADGEFTPIYKWDKSVVNTMARNQRYAGDMVQCRKRIQSYRTKKQVWNPKEDWIIVEDTHDGIVSREMYEAAQKSLDGRTCIIKRDGEPQIFSGIFWCEECGRRMAHHVHAKRDYLQCGRYRENGKEACSSHFIAIGALTDIVLEDIQRHATLLQNDEDKAIRSILASKCANEERQLSTAKKDLAKQKKRQSETDLRIKKVYEDNISGKLPDELFSTFLQDYETEKVTLRDSIRTLEETIRRLDSNKMDVSRFISLLREYRDIDTLDRHRLMALVDKITISEPPGTFGRKRDQTIRIYYKFVGIL